MTLHPQDVDHKITTELKQSGLSNDEIEEVAAVVFHFNFINRVADAVDFPLPDATQKRRQTTVLNLLARVVSGGTKPQPAWALGNDRVMRPSELDQARDELLVFEGSLDLTTRQAIEATAASMWNGKRDDVELPDSLTKFVKTLSLNAYKIFDEMVEELRDDGYTEHELFEVTLIGSFGAAVVAQENLFGALYGDAPNSN